MGIKWRGWQWRISYLSRKIKIIRNVLPFRHEVAQNCFYLRNLIRWIRRRWWWLRWIIIIRRRRWTPCFQIWSLMHKWWGNSSKKSLRRKTWRLKRSSWEKERRAIRGGRKNREKEKTKEIKISSSCREKEKEMIW